MDLALRGGQKQEVPLGVTCLPQGSPILESGELGVAPFLSRGFGLVGCLWVCGMFLPFTTGLGSGGDLVCSQPQELVRVFFLEGKTPTIKVPRTKPKKSQRLT